MAEPFLSEIRLMSFNFAPKGWALCNGQTMQINQNQALFSLLGTTFGGDGRVNFKLPDLRDRIPIHVGNGHTLGEIGGSEAVTIDVNSMPMHPHPLWASTADGDTNLPSGEILATASNVYGPPSGLTTLDTGHGDERRRQPAALEHAAVPDDLVLHRPAGHLPEPELRRRRWDNRMSVRFACSGAASPPSAGCSAPGRRFPSPSTRRSSS